MSKWFSSKSIYKNKIFSLIFFNRLSSNDKKKVLITGVSKGIGLGYINSNYSKTDSYVFIKIRDKLIKSIIVKLPFKA